MPWLGWIVLGALLLCAELLIVDAGFYLVFIGGAAMITGVAVLAGAGLVPWAQWLLFACVAGFSMIFFRRKVYSKLRGGEGAGYETGPAGEVITLDETLAPGQTGRQSFRGTEWSVVNDGAVELKQGEAARITAVAGLTLKLNSAENS